MSGPRRVGLVFGGASVEHEVSVQSARSVADALGRGGLCCVPIGVTGDGRWLGPRASKEVLDRGCERVEVPGDDDGSSVVIAPAAGAVECVGGRCTPLQLDVVFPLVHGRGGEDGRLQGLLELAGVPYVGAGVLGSAAAMDKAVARRIFESHGLPGVAWLELHQPVASPEKIARTIGYPLFVKPANGGSSVGITRVAAAAGLGAALDAAFRCDPKVVVEAAVCAREIECAVIGNEEPRASCLGEIVPSGEFYDYASKYVDDASELRIPAALDPALAETLRSQALAAYRALGLSGFARVDFLLERETGRPFLNEVNTLPGFTSISMFPKLWEASGLAFPELVARLVDLALERHGRAGRIRTEWKVKDD